MFVIFFHCTRFEQSNKFEVFLLYFHVLEEFTQNYCTPKSLLDITSEAIWAWNFLCWKVLNDALHFYIILILCSSWLSLSSLCLSKIGSFYLVAVLKVQSFLWLFLYDPFNICRVYCGYSSSTSDYFCLG